MLEQCSICGISEDNLEDGKCEYCLHKSPGHCSACGLHWTDIFSDGLCMKCWEVKKLGGLHIFDRESSRWTEKYVNNKLQNRKRIKSVVFYWAFAAFLLLSILILVDPVMFARTTVVLLISCAPFLLIYPILRHFSGGEDTYKVFFISTLVTFILNILLRKKLSDLEKRK